MTTHHALTDLLLDEITAAPVPLSLDDLECVLVNRGHDAGDDVDDALAALLDVGAIVGRRIGPDSTLTYEPTEVP